ncbi:hypothetical protein SUGI_0966150 [Cryptomeria japonica]|uniref:uncharacterized protein LOC131858574 n=1 Tax=Cryptomeria japonica TaxID=3369 RepID=UPI002414ABBF|nr:uncharacterized protein LOC131858574 [Cryptomeria japonica]GLJ45894.1 hypothetical protein SUGI_0966150 [Cryptomeria japonica]
MAYYPRIICNTNPRHKHQLTLCEGLPPYKCNGCKEYGANIGYCCSSCQNFTLHEVCGAYPDIYVHTFYPDHEFRFRKKTRLSHKCDACGEDLRGFVYEAPTGNLLKPLRFHPLCIALPTSLNYGGHKEHPLRLIMDTGGIFSCSRCNENKSGWSYRCDDMACRLRVDLNCVKVDNHALSNHGIASMNHGSFKR